MQLIVLTPPANVSGEIESVNYFFREGLQKLHLRKPVFSVQNYREYILSIAPEFHSRIIIHGGYELTKEFGLGGIHINSGDRNKEAEFKRLSPTLLSSSFHSWEELIEEGSGFDEAFISPVFDSISKPGYKAAIDLSGIDAVRKTYKAKGIKCPAIIGLGGVTAENISVLRKHGFDGAAMLGGIWTKPPLNLPL